MSLRQTVGENSLAIFLKMLPDKLKEVWQFAKNNARCGNKKTKSKSLTDILMLTHALEKAFSLPNPRKSFGITKAKDLTTKINEYVNKYNWDNSLSVPVSVLKKYIAYHRKSGAMLEEMKAIEEDLNSLLGSVSMLSCSFTLGGTYDVTREELITASKSNFETLSANRYAIRDFSGEPIDQEIIYKALDIAKKTPSACNRQSYRVHVFKGCQKDKLLKMQGGANSFYQSADSVLLISADANRYYTRESHLGYVDASLFSMTLIYALTYLGIGSIPLTLCIKQTILENMKKEFHIPHNEIPVLLIAIGNYPDKFKVAMSHRNEVDSFTTFH